MNEQDIRELVREAIERHLPGGGSRSLSLAGADVPHETRTPVSSVHSSHVLLNVIPGSQLDDGSCIIEPAVRCNHCGFCQSYGH